MAYDTIENADLYFENRLHVHMWKTALDADKEKALEEATAIIDRLHYSGKLVDEDQSSEFPRYYGCEPDGTETVPDDIKIACFEIAFALIKGVDPEKEYKELGVISRRFADVATTKRIDFLYEHTASGVPSPKAWSYLKPYLASKKISIFRTS